MKLEDVLGEWDGRRGKDPCRVRIERDAVYITTDASKGSESLNGATVEERDREVCFWAEKRCEDVAVVLRADESGAVRLAWLDGIFPFSVQLSRPKAKKTPRGAKRAARRKREAERRERRRAKAPGPPRDVEAAFEALIKEAARTWDDDNPFRPGPRPGPNRAEVARFGAEACPVLIAALGSENRLRRVQAAELMSMIWASASDDGREALREAGQRYPEDVGPWLFNADPDAGRPLGVHRHPLLWLTVFHRAVERDASFSGALLAEHLEDPEMLELVLASEVRRSAPIARIASTRPDLVPVTRLRELRSHADASVHEGATGWLKHLNQPEDLQAALLAPTRADLAMVDRLAAWPASDRLFALFGDVGRKMSEEERLASLVVRRRCAGLPNPTDRVRSLLEPTLEAGRDHLVLSYTFRAAWGLGDRRLDDLVQAAAERVPDAQLCRGSSLEAADKLFRDGAGDNWTAGFCAFLAYAGALFDRENAHAAFQLAWIDRAFGAPSHPTRIAWIRGLGFRDEELLGMLGEAPAYPLPGPRRMWRTGTVATQLNPRLLALHAAVVEQAGLPGKAAAVFAIAQTRTGKYADDQARCAEATRDHLARVARACG